MDNIQFNFDKLKNEYENKEKYLIKEKEDLNNKLLKLQNNDYTKLESKYIEKSKELSNAQNELKSLKEKGTSEYLKNNFTFELEKKSL